VTSVENTEKCFKTLRSRTKDGEDKSENESEIGSKFVEESAVFTNHHSTHWRTETPEDHQC
jgi:hypothetical protein